MKGRDIYHNPCVSTQTWPLLQMTLYQCVTIKEPTLTHHLSYKGRDLHQSLFFLLYSLCWDKHNGMCLHFGTLQNSFTTIKSLYASPVPSCLPCGLWNLESFHCIHTFAFSSLFYNSNHAVYILWGLASFSQQFAFYFLPKFFMASVTDFISALRNIPLQIFRMVVYIASFPLAHEYRCLIALHPPQHFVLWSLWQTCHF